MTGSHERPSPSRAARALDASLRLYQWSSVNRLPRCRFSPTCSQYAREAVVEHGAGRGVWLALRRLGRCHPLGGHGFDPVPEAHRLRGADPC